MKKLLEKKNYMFQKLRMNKILNTNESNNENKLITNYFKNLSQFTKRGNNSENNLEYLNEQIDYINNDNSINNLNEDQKANYVQNLSDITRILEINLLKKDNKKLKNQMDLLMKNNIKLSNELYDLKKQLEKLEQKVEYNNKKYEKKKNYPKEKETISVKKDVEEIRNKIKEEEEKERKVKEEEEENDSGFSFDKKKECMKN